MIGREPESVDGYLARISAQIADQRTHLYFDASFLMWLAKIGNDGRGEFERWLERMGPSRFHVPLWAAHEFFKHRVKQTTTSELSARIKAFDNASSELYEKLSLYQSDLLFGFENSGTIFLDEYRRTVQPIRAMLKIAEKSDHCATGIAEVSVFIDDRLLPGPMSEVMKDLEADERVRNRGVVPPSFNDAHKRGAAKAAEQPEKIVLAGDNSFGDLVFWREILRHSTGVKAKATVIVTADRKNDWFENHFGDAGLTPDFRKRTHNRALPVPAPHPLLVREAFDHGAGQLSMIDPMYCGALLERSGQDCTAFAAAALDTHLPQPLASKDYLAKKWAARFGAEARMLGAQVSFPPSEAEEEDPFDRSLLKSAMLLTAGTLNEANAAPIAAIRSGSLAERAAIFDSLDLQEMQDWETTSLVVLGRVVLGIAEKGDAKAAEFLSQLRDLAPQVSAATREPLCYGVLGASYFDGELEPRTPSGSPVMLTVMDIAVMREAQNAASAVTDLLTQLGVKRHYRPGETRKIQIEVVTKPSADNKSPADLQSVKVNGEPLTTGLQTEEALRFNTLTGNPPGDLDLKVGAILEILSRYHLLPRQLMESDTNADTTVRVVDYAGVEIE